MKHNKRNQAFCLSLIFLLVIGFSACGGGADEEDEHSPYIAPPTDLMAAINSSSEIVISWEDHCFIEHGFHVERSTDGTTFSSLGSTSANATTYSDATVSGGTTYWYRVCAFIHSDYSSYTNIASATTPWAKTYGGTDTERAQSIWHTSGGGFITTGHSVSFGGLWVVKLDSEGTVDWEKSYGESGSWGERIIQQTSDGGYIVAGYTKSFGAGNGDVWVLKLNSDGSAYWQKRYGGAQPDYSYRVQQTDDEGFAVAGTSYAFGAGQSDFWVLKLASDGSIDFDPASGAAESPTTATVTDTSATVTVTTISPVSTSVTETVTSFTATDTAAIIHQQAPQT
ncbi:MAG: fibronectin type III domain-containing protein [Candidatus Aminicenantes bacterium]|nr:fibronectin type III domain-containing protein [Candidatus Aminicenantes bacterium]MDH5706389.1 fibronectin type III domain-containing protein [Candidatus Aminicenantes bacterium]